MPKAQLLELYAHGLGVIDDARLEFGPGFNVLTGETGAGKTLLVDALALCLGAAVTSSRYALTSGTRAVALFERDGVELAFTREAGDSGRLKSSLNGAPSSAEALRTLADDLIVVHGQHDSLALTTRVEVTRLLDLYGHVDTSDLDATRAVLTEARRERDALGGDPSARDRELDFQRFQIREIDDAAILSADELSDVLEELTTLTTLRDSQVALESTLRDFDDESDDAVLARFARALASLPSGGAYDEARAALRESLIGAREAIRSLAALTNPDGFDEAATARLEERASALRQVARKYGGNLAAALALRDDLARHVARLEGAQDLIDALDEKMAELEARERELARRARADREYAASALTNAVRAQLSRVALANASLRFVVEGDDGSDAQIYFTPNPGLPEGPLSALASGGELSRVLLALSLETAREDVVAVFDEVDAGLGGQVAQQIGECLAEVGRRQQVLAITHLASVAARADHHFVIEKSVSRGVTSTAVRVVRGDERVREVARMLAGDDVTDESRALARQLIENSGQVASAVTRPG